LYEWIGAGQPQGAPCSTADVCLGQYCINERCSSECKEWIYAVIFLDINFLKFFFKYYRWVQFVPKIATVNRTDAKEDFVITPQVANLSRKMGRPISKI